MVKSQEDGSIGVPTAHIMLVYIASFSSNVLPPYVLIRVFRFGLPKPFCVIVISTIAIDARNGVVIFI